MLDYAKTTASIVRTVTRAEVKDTRTIEEKADDFKSAGDHDPMEVGRSKEAYRGVRRSEEE